MIVDLKFSIFKSDSGNIFFFLLPFINFNWYFRKTDSQYLIISIGFLIFHLTFYVIPKNT